MREIRKVGVIGAGVMGSGIAAHVANAGIPVVLLDIVPKGANDRDMLAKGALEKMKKADPAPFMSTRAQRLVTPGNIEDHLDTLKDADWIVEAVLEDLDIKRSLYARLEAVRAADSIISSNTSTIPLNLLVEGRSEAFRRNFLITHFFNPPRYMRLLELVRGADTSAEAVDAMRAFCDVALGKGVVDCHDTPGFIANRIGTFWMQAGFNAALDLGLTVEEVDAVNGRPMGVPKTGVFGLIDLVGIDLMPHLSKSMLATLPPDDAYRQIFRPSPLVERMIADGYTGRKGKGGFYRLNREGGQRLKEAIDLQTGTYRPERTPALESLEAGARDLKALVSHPDRGGRYAWAVLSQTLHYAASLVPEIANRPDAVDDAMRLGYNWKFGPFELIDQLGPAWFAERLRAEGRSVPPLVEQVGQGGFYRRGGAAVEVFGTDGRYHPVERPGGVLKLEDVKRRGPRLLGNRSASLWDIGDGVVCLEIHTKMNVLDPDVFTVIGQLIGTIAMSRGKYKALVIHNDADTFSAGANLGLAMFALNIGLYDQVEQSITLGQQMLKALKFAKFPVVSAPRGLALGGGCEILLHSDAIQAHAELYAGLVESGVGVVPGWGGCKEMLLRHAANPRAPRGPMPPVAGAFETIALAKVSKSAAEAQELLILREGDGITMNADRVLADAKAKALALAEAYQPPQPRSLKLPGAAGRAAIRLQLNDMVAMGRVTPHDQVVAGHLAEVLTGGETDLLDEVSEDRLGELEREAFSRLVRTKGTVERIEHMLETGKPLRN